MNDNDPASDEAARTPTRLRRGGTAGWLLVVVLSLVVFAVFGVTIAGRTVRSPGPVLIVCVTLLPYVYAVTGVLVFAAWCVVPDRRALPFLLAAVALVAGGLWGPSFPARPESARGQSLRVMSWNVQRFWGGDDGVDAVECVVEGITAADPDVLTLLEVSRDALTAIEDRLAMACVHADYFGTNDATRGGLAVCARRDALLVSGQGQRFIDDGNWQYVAAQLSTQGRRFNVLAVHLQPYWPLTGAVMRQSVSDLAAGQTGPILEVSRDSTAVVARQGTQSAALLDRVSQFVDPTLIAGDFNSTRDTALHSQLRRSFVDTYSRGSRGFGSTVTALGWVPLRVDYIYATPDFAVSSARLGPANCSDHRPVFSQLVLRDDER